jgi:4-hydroxy-2-oxoheptanedioate aldolase
VDLPRNRFKAGLIEGRRQFGLWLNLANAYSTEISAGAGFDWLVIDGEHAPNDVPSVLAQLQTLAAYPVQAIVRIAHGDAVTIKRILDIGAQTILVPMVESAGQAKHLAEAMRYPPHGVRGVASSVVRASRWNRIAGYLTKADAEVCLIVQLETIAGLDELEGIAAVDGVDAIFIGPADLAASMGHLGNSRHPDVQQAVEDGIRRIRKAGKPAGILASDEALIRRYLDLGCTFVGVGLDASLLATVTQELATKYMALKDKSS